MTCLFLLSCHKELAKDGDIYLGYIHFRDMSWENANGEFRVTYVKDLHTIYFNKSPDVVIELNYDKKTKDFAGDFYWTNYSHLYYRGKKINGDFIITLYYFGGAVYSGSIQAILVNKVGDIYLTPK